MRSLKMSLIILVYMALEMVYCSAQEQISLDPTRYSTPNYASYIRPGLLKRSLEKETEKEAVEKDAELTLPVAAIEDEPQEIRETENEVDLDLGESSEKDDLTPSTTEGIEVKEETKGEEEKKFEEDVKKPLDAEDEVVEKVEKEKEGEKDDIKVKAEEKVEKKVDEGSSKDKESEHHVAIKARFGPRRKNTERERPKARPTTAPQRYNGYNSYQPAYQYNPNPYSYPYNPSSNRLSYNPYSQPFSNYYSGSSANWQYPQYNQYQYLQNTWQHSQNQWPTQYPQNNRYPAYTSYNYNSLNPYGLRDYSNEYERQFFTKYGGSVRSPYFMYEHLQRKKRKAHNVVNKHAKKHH